MDYNKFSHNLQAVLSRTREIASNMGTSYIGSEHLVYAMLITPECTAYAILKASGVSEERYRRYLVNSADHNSSISGFTPRTKHMFERAVDLAVEYGGEDALAGTEHLMHAVMESPECLAMRILRALGLEENFADVVACPTCGRCEWDCMALADKVERRAFGSDKRCKIAVMGCVVNGPGEAADADLGIAGGKDGCLIFRKGEPEAKVPRERAEEEFLKRVDELLAR